MNIRKHVARFVITTAALILGAVPQANAGVVEYVTNGTFTQLSSPGQPTGWAIPGWVLQTGFAQNSGNSLRTPCSGPGFCIADASQTLTDPAAELLNGSFWYLPGTFGPPNDLIVLVNGVQVLDVPNLTSKDWVKETFAFTSAGSDLLEIKAWNFPASSFISNVSVTGPATVTPEPSGFALIGAALLLAPVLRRVGRIARTEAP
jgi:hypothetical protein